MFQDTTAKTESKCPRLLVVRDIRSRIGLITSATERRGSRSVAHPNSLFPEMAFQYNDGRDEPPSSDVFIFAIVCVPSLPPQENSKCT